MGQHKVDLPPLPNDGWRDQAACTERALDALWDDRVDGETEEQRQARHNQAKAICWGKCPVRAQCAAAVDWKYDEGIRGGHKLPTLDLHRSKNDVEMLRLLKKGWPLDEAARRAG